jgi:hypothetical protein
MDPSWSPLLTALLLLPAWLPASAADGPPEKAYLLEVSKGKLTNDTGLEDKTRPELVDDFRELGGKAMKVTFAAGDSIGMRSARVVNWRGHTDFRFDVFNPAKEDVELEVNVLHARSKNYNTRISTLVQLRPGKNEVRLPIAGMKNNDGSAADLENVTRWYFANPKDNTPTLYFGDVWLEGKGGESGPATGSDKLVRSDPARLARIRAATMPAIAKPVPFDTPEADAIATALEVFPPDNPWNLLVKDWPVHPRSRRMIAAIGANLPFRYNLDMGYIFVGPRQKRIDVNIVGYPDESDKGPFPLPDNVPIEGWPLAYKGLTLEQAQRKKEDADRHGLVIDPVNRMLYEFYQLRRTDRGWEATQTSVFDLKSNRLRPDGWTSTDAAGLPIFPAVVRYDELKRGRIDHAMRVTFPKTRRAYVYPATHLASRLTNEDLPRMGERLRLRQDFDISRFSREAQVILTALKRYGTFNADNGIAWAISVAPDRRIPNMNEELRRVKGSDFEVVEPPAGYRAPRD